MKKQKRTTPQLPGVDGRLTGQAKSMQEDTAKEAILTQSFGPRESWSPELAEKLATYFNPPQQYTDPEYLDNKQKEVMGQIVFGAPGISGIGPMIGKLAGIKGITKGAGEVKEAVEKVVPLKEVFKFMGRTGSKRSGAKNLSKAAKKTAEEIAEKEASLAAAREAQKNIIGRATRQKKVAEELAEYLRKNPEKRP